MVSEKLIKKQPFEGKIAIMCGASSGIGRATAKEFVQLGGSALINARRAAILEEAINEIKELTTNDSQFVEMLSCDTSDIEKLKPHIEDFIKKHGVPDYLFNFVGYALPNYVETQKMEDFESHFKGNYFGQLVPSLILIPHFMEAKMGHIIFTSSLAYYYPMIGYSTYLPAKSAIVGFANVIRNELKPYKIKISIVYPSDTDTPAFQRELKTSPEECRIISERGKIFTPEEIAEPLIKGILKGKYEILPGFIAKSAWWFQRHIPKLVRKLIDSDLKKARKKMGKDYKY